MTDNASGGAYAPGRQDGAWLVGLLALYFALHAVLRLWTSPYLELDEAALMITARDFHLGYGGQFPLYEWIQALAFDIFGMSPATVIATRNLCLFAAYVLMWRAIAPLVPDRRAIVATLSLLLLPEISWEAQRTLSHSVAMILMTAMTLYALSRVMRRGSWGDYALLGVAVGLGGLSKANYWFAVAGLLVAGPTLPGVRRLIAPGRLAASAGIAGAILLLPMQWIATHRETSLSALEKFSRDAVRIEGSPWVNTLVETVLAVVAGLVLLGLVLLILRWLAGRRGAGPAVYAPVAEAFIGLILRAGWIGLLLCAVVMTAIGATHVSPRWLTPLFMMIAPALTLRVLGRDSAAALRGGMRIIVGIALLILVAVPVSRRSGASNISPDFAALHAELMAEGLEDSRIIPRGHALGNLISIAPETYLPGLEPDGDEKPIVILVPGGTAPEQALKASGIDPKTAGKITGPHRIDIPDIVDPDASHPFDIYRTDRAP